MESVYEIITGSEIEFCFRAGFYLTGESALALRRKKRMPQAKCSAKQNAVIYV